MGDIERKFEEKLADLKLQYAKRLEEKLQEFERLSVSMTSGSVDDDGSILTEIQQNAHKLAGSAATFGFPELGDAAADLEEFCVHLTAGGGPVGQDQRDQVAERISAFRTLMSKD